MRMLVVDQCSNAKDYPDWFTPFDADTLDSVPRDELIEREKTPAIAARALYAGRQQRFVSEAVDQLRDLGDDVTRVFVSAGFGVVNEDALLPPYDVTFADLSASEIDERAEQLEIGQDVVELLSRNAPFDAVFFLLGKDYYRSIHLKNVLEHVPEQTMAVVSNHEDTVDEFGNAVSLPARTAEAKDQGTIVVALKGKYLKNFAEHRRLGKEVSSLEDLRSFCLQSPTQQFDLDTFGS